MKKQTEFTEDYKLSNNMKINNHQARMLIGLFNSTLKSLKMINNEDNEKLTGELIANGILLTISKKSVATEFINYIFKIYGIKLQNIHHQFANL